MSIEDKVFFHNCSSEFSGFPLISRYTNFIIGMNVGFDDHKHLHWAIPIHFIIDDIKNKNVSDFITSINYKEIYKHLYLIGSGNFGNVYKGRIEEENENQNMIIETDNYKALKIINKEEIKKRLRTEFNNDNVEEKFKLYICNYLNNEIANMKICMKDNINSVQLYEVYDNEEEYVLVMEYCDDNLQNILNKKKNGFNKDEIYDILSQLNNTFKIMSKKNIIHRDLKLDNILIKYDNNKKYKFIVKLSDYGVSRQMLSLSKKCKTYVGTTLTMAPEVLAGEEYDKQCDLWSLGVIIYQLFFKKYPYNGLTEIAIYKQISQFGQKCLSKTGDKNLDDLIRKLLVKDPNKRIEWEEYFKHPFFKKGK